MIKLNFMGLLKLLTLFTTVKPIQPAQSYFQELQSPCPDVFQYDFDQNTQQLFGNVQIYPPEDNSIHLRVELSLGNAVRGYQGSIEVPYTKAEVISIIMERKPLKYRVYFPVWNRIPPKVTKISVNDRIYCYGSKVPFNSAPVITTIYLEHTLKVNIAPLSSGGTFKPAENNNNNNNNNDNSWQFHIDQQDIRINENNNKNNNNNWQNPYNFNPPGPPKDAPPQVNDFTLNTQRPNMNNRPPPPPPPSSTTNLAVAYPENPFFTNSISTTSESNIAPQRPVTERADTFVERTTEQTQNKPPPRQGGPTNSIVQPNSDICGVPSATNSLVVNGDKVPKGSFPWLVALYHGVNEGLLYKCCGSLITNRHVVTAAHCVHRKNPNEIILRVGRSNIKDWIPDPDEKYMIAEKIKTHPDYRPLSANADIGLVTVRNQVEFTKFIRPICLWRDSNDLSLVVNQEGVVAGWGKDENGVPRTAEPRQVSLPIVSQEQCLRSAYQYRDITSNTTFCAGSLNGQGPCNGDSGSGFIMKRGGRWVLRGIVSIALPSETNLCDLKNYIVFADASKYTNWLLSNIK